MLVPALVVTETPSFPSDAPGAIVKVAVNEFGLVTLTVLTLTPLPTETLVAPADVSKLAPLIVTVALVPCNPDAGVMEVIVGSAMTLNARVLLVP